MNENASDRPIEGIAAVGGNWFEKMAYAVTPQVLPNFFSYAMLRFEINVRASSIIGFVGAGGIGQELNRVISFYSDVGVLAVLILVVLMVTVIDLISERIRLGHLRQERVSGSDPGNGSRRGGVLHFGLQRAVRAARLGRMVIDGLQYANWSERIFRQMREGGVDAVHVTIAYHEQFRETVANIEAWNRRFERFPDLIRHARTADDIRRAREEGRTAIVFGAQTPAPIEDDIGLVEIMHTLGLRFMQLSYNNQSLLATGCYETEDPGITRMGREVIAEMNRVGLVVDMSHSAERSTLEAIELSQRPIAITHANPAVWHPAKRNKSDTLLRALAESGGILGFSLYPHHLRGGSDCTLQDFCEMVARTAETMGVERLGIGSDLCQDQPDSVVEWMRAGRWTKKVDYGEGSADAPGFPPQPDFFRDNRDFHRLREGLHAAGFDAGEVEAILGGNWLRFFDASFGAAA